MSYIIENGRWCRFVLKVHDPVEVKDDDATEGQL
jgi:hypothetical protein